MEAFKNPKNDIVNLAITAIDPAIPLVVEKETDASDFAIAASLRQSGRSVSFLFFLFKGICFSDFNQFFFTLRQNGNKFLSEFWLRVKTLLQHKFKSRQFHVLIKLIVIKCLSQ